jgi:hypothetical protein
MHTASHALSMLTVRREGLQWSKETTASATAVLDTYGKHVGELDHLIQPVALRVQVSARTASALSRCPDASVSCAHRIYWAGWRYSAGSEVRLVSGAV